jgi:hypothetical protein
MMKTEFHGHGDPLFQAVNAHQQNSGPDRPEELPATQNTNETTLDGHHGDPLLHEFLEYDRVMTHRHHALHLEGHGDPLLVEYAKQWGLEEDVHAHAHAETELHTLGGFPEFHFQGDPLFDESMREHNRQNLIAQKKKHSKASDEPGAGSILGDHIWTLIDVMKH